jgi:hypothetical protein
MGRVTNETAISSRRCERFANGNRTCSTTTSSHDDSVSECAAANPDVGRATA